MSVSALQLSKVRALPDLYNEIPIPASSFSAFTTNGASPIKKTYGSNEHSLFAFSPSVEESVFISFRLPQDYNGGVFRWSVDWDADTTATGTVVWGLSGAAIADDGVLSVSLGTERTLTDTVLAVGDRHRSDNDTTGITLAGSPAAGDLGYFKLSCKTSGTVAVDAFLIALILQYQRNPAVATPYE